MMFLLIAALFCVWVNTGFAAEMIQPKPMPGAAPLPGGTTITPKPAITLLTVTSFKINNDAATATARTVTLNNTVSGTPTHYMASEKSDFAGASWQNYSAAPSFALSTGEGVKTVYFKIKDSTRTSPSISDTITLQTIPQVTEFYMKGANGDSKLTYYREVKLFSKYSGPAPLQYMASEDQNFANAAWQPYNAESPFTLSSGDGDKKVYFKVKNDAGTSAVKNALIPLKTRKLYKIKAEDFYNVAEVYGYNSRITSSSGPAPCNILPRSQCSSANEAVKSALCDAPDGSVSAIAVSWLYFTGSRCDFSFFGNKQLQPLWVFNTFTATVNVKNDGKMTLTSSPQSPNSVSFTVHGWASPPTEGQAWARYSIVDITLEGPVNTDWKKALIP